MAAGRHGGYRSSGFRKRGADFRMSKKEIGCHKDDFVRIRTGEHDYYRSSGRTRDSFDYCGRVRQKDIKERQVLVNGGRYPSACSRDAGGNGCGSRRCDFYPRNSNREPGVLSSDGSDGAIDSDIQVKKEADKLENGSTISPLLRKKRKFSPFFWGKDDREIRRAVMGKNDPETNALLPHPLPTTTIGSPTNLGDAYHSLDSNSKSALEHHQISERSPSQVVLPPDLSDFPSETSQLEEEQWVDGQEGAVIDDDNNDEPDLTIISSRWATYANSPVDDGEISVREVEHKWRRMCGSGLTEARRNRKSISPELGEIKREGSVETNRSLTGSHLYYRSSSRDNYHDNRDKECMEIDDDRKVYRASYQSHSECEDDHSSLGTPESGCLLQRSANMLQGCRSVDAFERLNKIDEGTYGLVYRAKDKRTGEIVALKKVKMEKEREGFPLTALREINILLSLNHPCIVDFKEVVVGSRIDDIFIVMEYMEHDLKALMETMKQPFSQSEVKCLMLQLLEGTKYLHDNWVLHRDLKTSNLLLNNRGVLKICDFGLARHFGSSLRPYTQKVVTLWYRAPELLLGAKEYSTAIDMWALGCIMAELLSKEPLFNGGLESQQLDKIYEILGTPTEAIWPGLSKLPETKVNSVKHKCNLLRKKFPAMPFTGSPVLSDAGFDLLNKLLTYDPAKRITAEEALKHEWFREVPLPKSKEFMPTFPAHHAQDR